jgi:tricorn protease-like protein
MARSSITSVPAECNSILETGLPVSEALVNTHILFIAGSEGHSTDQIWAYDIKENTQSLLIDNLSSIRYQTAGFLMDGFHFILVSSGKLWLSDLNGIAPRDIDQSDPDYKAILDLIPPNAWAWRVYRNQDEGVSPDGAKSAIWNVGDPYLIIEDKRTGEKANIIEYNHVGYISGNWSPDGSIYAFTFSIGFNGEASKLYYVNRDGTNLREIAKFEKLRVDSPYWSPDGQKIIFAAEGINFHPIYFKILLVSTGEVKTFPVDAELSGNGTGYSLHWSPDSQWVSFVTEEFVSDHWTYYINVLNVETGEYYCLPNEKELIEVIADWR